MSLFPLGAVLFPGVMLPLHIFEPRYRKLIRDLLAEPEGLQRFGVVSIKVGRETGAQGVTELHDVGCTAELRRVEELPDGRFEVITTGTTRFRVLAVDGSQELVRAEVEFLDETRSERSDALAGKVRRVFLEYYAALLDAQGIADGNEPELPRDPVDLSYLVADSILVDDSDKQLLLAAETVDSRLERELVLLHREITMIRDLALRPAVELQRQPYSQN